ncbi:MAG: hypothetical protein AUK63_520 [bacterium P3]|nr:MAG: hypothetical protein AUK63_520 [bacterium P3]KWW41976.1 MAG: hypothetical protein F083_627 [bacterium F083]
MAEITLRVSNESLLPSFRKLIRSINGIDIVPAKRKRKNGIEQALEDEALMLLMLDTGSHSGLF